MSPARACIAAAARPADELATLRKEIRELKLTAEESIEELRRNLRMMREDFELTQGLEDYVKTFRDRTQLAIHVHRFTPAAGEDTAR